MALTDTFQSFLFLSTPSARRATAQRRLLGQRGGISIHALREEGDGYPAQVLWPCRDFYPRPPRGGRQWGYHSKNSRGRFLSTPSARRATCSGCGKPR